MKYYLAVDIGASSGRHILAHVEDGKMILEEVYRFENGASKRNGHDCWDLDHLYQSILNGMKACGEMGKAPVSMGIDTFGVDFVLLDDNGEIIGDTVAYRDARNEGMDKIVEKTVSWEELYSRAGIQKAVFNSIYQLTALQQEHPEQLAAAKRFLMIPEYFNYRLTGNDVNEYTNNTTSSLINARTKTWDWEILEKLNIPTHIFKDPAMPGTLVGTLTEEAADVIKTAIVTGTGDMLLHKFNSLITGSDINACRCVAFRSGFVMHYIIPFRSSNRYRAQIRRYRSPL